MAEPGTVEGPTNTVTAEAAGLAMWTLVTALPLFGWTMLAGRLSVSPLALAAAVLATAWVARRLTRRWVWVTAAACAALGLSALVCARFFDISWDGQAYHQEAVLRLAGGWNPLWDGPLDVARRPDDLWVNCYPQGAWIAAAALFRLTGHLEAAKALNLFAMAAAFLLSYAALSSYDVRRRTAVTLSALAALNPIAVCQSLTFYVDGLMACALTVLAALTALWWRRPRPGLLVAIAATIVFASNLKFTGVVYGGLYAASLSLAVLARRRATAKPVVLTLAGALVTAVLVVGYSPYVTNTRSHRHPFHPLAGPRAIDVLPLTVSKELLSAQRPVALTRSILSRSSITLDAPEWKLPFTLRASELENFAVPDVVVGGFGPLFGGALLLALVAFSIGAIRRAPGAATAALLAAALVGSALVNPGLSVARYVPQIWLLPFILLAGARPPALGALTAGVLALNVLLITGAFLHGQRTSTRNVRNELAWLEASRRGAPVEVRFSGFESNRQRFDEAHLPYVAPARLGCPAPTRLQHSLATVCLPAP